MQGEVQEDASRLAMRRGYDVMLALNYSCEKGFSLPRFFGKWPKTHNLFKHADMSGDLWNQ
jgi:hypothetical protein